VPVPCDASWGGIGSAGQVIDGVERTTSIGRDRCVDPGGRSFVCDVSHARGWLEEAERDAAIALCAGLTLR
ncbi:MAG: hypothetical protein ABMB14_26560, partial [Myxococcota bacterium]